VSRRCDLSDARFRARDGYPVPTIRYCFLPLHYHQFSTSTRYLAIPRPTAYPAKCFAFRGLVPPFVYFGQFAYDSNLTWGFPAIDSPIYWFIRLTYSVEIDFFDFIIKY